MMLSLLSRGAGRDADGEGDGDGDGDGLVVSVGEGVGVPVCCAGLRVGVVEPAAVPASRPHPARPAPRITPSTARRDVAASKGRSELVTMIAAGRSPAPVRTGTSKARTLLSMSMPDTSPTGTLARARTTVEASLRRVLPHRLLPLILLVNAICQGLIVVTGGLVRLTGSGLGCPTWPQCVPGSYVPVQQQAQGFHKFIEFGNRTLTGVLLVAAVAAVVAVVLWTPTRRDLKIATSTVVAGVILQAVLGGVTVLVGLHPITVAGHFLLSAVLVAVATFAYAVRSAPLSDSYRVPLLVRRLAFGTCAVGAVVLVLGTLVTGSGPHSGDAQAPARFGLDPRAISWLHADTVMLFVGLVVATWVAVRLTADHQSASRAWTATLLVTLGQGVVGYTQYFTSLPAVLVLVHMLGAVLLVVALTYGMVMLRRPLGPGLSHGGPQVEGQYSGRWSSGSTATARKTTVT